MRLRVWWPDEQPSKEIMQRVESQFDKPGWRVDAVLHETTPLRYDPIEAFLPGRDQSKRDRFTDEWLD